MIEKNIDDYNRIFYLIDKNFPESDVLEYKYTFPKKRENLIRIFYAFANSKGGIVIIGIKGHPELEIVGISKGEKTLDLIDEISRLANLEGLLSHKIVDIPEYQNRVIVIFKVLPSGVPLLSPIKKEFYMRINSQNIKFDPKEFDYDDIKTESDFTREIILLLHNRECEFLDFKLEMYKIFPKNSKYGIEQRKELLKDLLSLINNKTEENNKGTAYLLIGVGEKNEKYNGIHKNIDFNDFQALIQIINEYITPKFNLYFKEYYISGDVRNILIQERKVFGFDRNILMKIRYEPGTVYEIKKQIGNIDLNIPSYYPGLSFTRDLSYSRWLLHEDRERIIRLRDIL